MSTIKTNNVVDLAGNVLLAKGQAAKYVESMQDLLAANMESHKAVNVLNYHTRLEGGGGVFYWEASRAKTEHNGGTVIDPAIVFPTDWNNQTQLTTWFTAGASGTGCWVRQYDGAVNVKWFGAKGDGATDDTVALQKAINIGNTIDIDKGLECILDSVTVSNDITINLHGTLKHKSNSSSDMIISNNANNFTLIGDGTINGDMGNQTTFTNSLNTLGVKNVLVEGINFVNTKRHAIYAGSSSDIISVKNCNFVDGALFGTASDYCVFIAVFPSKTTNISNCTFKQTSLPASGRNNNPSAIVFSGATATMYCSVNVSDCYFENLGFYVGSSLLATVDCYGYRDSISYINNIVKSPLLGALRITNFKTANVSNNTIYQDVDCIQDGGTTYTYAASITVSLVQRGYADNKRINATANILNNTIIRTGGGDNLRYTVLCANDSDATSYWFDRVNIENNHISGTTTTYGELGVQGVLNANISKNSLINTRSIRIANTLQTSIADKTPIYVCSENTLQGSFLGIHLYETDANPNVDCNLFITKNIFNTADLAFTVRYIGKVIVEDNIMPTGNNGDTYKNQLFAFTKNIIRHASDPTGYGSNVSYSLNNNYGRQSTINYLSAAPTAGTWKVGDIVYDTAPAASGFLGWVCTTAGTPGTWKTFGAISA